MPRRLSRPPWVSRNEECDLLFECVVKDRALQNYHGTTRDRLAAEYERERMCGVAFVAAHVHARPDGNMISSETEYSGLAISTATSVSTQVNPHFHLRFQLKII